MNNSWVENVISNFFTSRVDLFGEQSTYRGFETDTPSESSTQAVPDGLNSVPLQGKIIYREKQTDVCKALPIFIKIMPDSAITGEFLSFAYSNEINFYTKNVPKFGTFHHSVYSLFPKFYHAEMMFNDRQIKSAIIFEDLKTKGYKLADKRTFLDYDHLTLMMRKLGQFHAYSYKAKNTSPEWFLSMAKSFQETEFFLTTGDHHKLLKQVVVQRGLDALEQHSEHLPYLEILMQNVTKIHRRVLTGDVENPVSVIVHGDYLRNNVMFRYAENNIPDDVLMIDMATCRYGSPVIDLAHVMYVCADQITRNKYWDRLIDEYYAALKETFPENQVPSREEILNEFVGKSFYNYLVAGYYVPLSIALDDHMPYPDDIDANMAKKYYECDFMEFTDEMESKLLLRVGGEKGTLAIKSILQDMIDRGFICKQFKFD